ncbi:MAG TPA: ABC transporter ATP-binding protein [Candidatus Binataceae bacterium]
MSARPYISVRGLSKTFNGKAVLRSVDFDVSEGETLVVLGGSGQGKSVILRHLNGLVAPDEGEVWIDGRSLKGLSENQLYDVRRKVAMVFQLGALFDSQTVYGNVGYPLREHAALTEPQIAARVAELLAMVDLKGTERLYPAELSGGMRKRVALARALALEPRAVLYDEPTTGLDPIVTMHINELIRRMQRQLGFTSVVVTHDLKSAFTVGDRFALLDNGRIRFSGTAAEAHATRDELMQEFLKAAF